MNFDTIITKLQNLEIYVTLKDKPRTEKEREFILKKVGKELTNTLKKPQNDYSRHKNLLGLRMIIRYLKRNNKGYNPNDDKMLNTPAIDHLLKNYNFYSKKSKTI